MQFCRSPGRTSGPKPWSDLRTEPNHARHQWPLKVSFGRSRLVIILGDSALLFRDAMAPGGGGHEYVTFC